MSNSQLSQLEQLQHVFRELVGRETAVIVRAPTVIRLLGAELEPGEGCVLAGAIEPATWLAAAPTTDSRVTVRALNLGETAAFQLPHLELFASSVGGNWINFPMGAAWALQKAGQQLVGMDVVLVGGSAAALAFVLAWEALAGFQLEPLSRAHLVQKAESAYVGVSTGMMTPFLAAASRANHLVFADGRTFAHELLPLPASVSVVLVDSGVREQATRLREREKACGEAAAVLRQHLPHIKTLRDVSQDDLELYGHHLPEELRRCAAHVVGESARVEAGIAALRAGDLAALGRLMRQSQISLRDNYAGSMPELDLLAATAWSVPGCYGARTAGGGFGDFLQVLVEETAVPQLIDALNTAFSAEFGRTPASLVSKLTDGANVIDGR